jgi:hypothetical protein
MKTDPLMTKKCLYQNVGSVLNLNFHLEWWQLQMFIVDELAFSQWRGEFLSMKLCPFISVFCFFLGLFFIVPMMSCIPIILHPQSIILAFTETIWSSWKMCSRIYLYSWVKCPHAVLSFVKHHASAGSSNVYRHLEGVNSVLWLECFMMVEEEHTSEQWVATS